MTVGTDEFSDLLQFEADQRGLPDLRRVIVPHPLGGIDEEHVRAKAPASIDEIITALTTNA